MFSSRVSRSVAVVVFGLALGSSALAGTFYAPLDFGCSVYARIVRSEPPYGEWVDYGTNVASVTEEDKHADIAFTSGSSVASLHAFTTQSLIYGCSVGTLTPSRLYIGTTSALPAGTPLELTLEGTLDWLYLPELALDLNRGATNLAHVTFGNFPRTGMPLTIPVLAGETLDVVYSQASCGTDMTMNFTAVGVPEPGGLLLLVVGLLVVRRRGC